MATGLFDMVTPQQAQQAYLDQFTISPQQIGQQGLLQQVVSQMGNAGAGIGAGVGRLFGGMSPQEAEAQRVQGIMSGVDMTSSEGLLTGARRASQLGDFARAQALTQQGMEMKKAEEALKPKDDSASLLKDFTAESVAKYKKSGNFSDLVRYEKEADKKLSSYAQALVDSGLQPNTPEFQQKMQQYTNAVLREKTKPSSSVTIPPGEKAEQADYGKFLVKNFADLSTEAGNAQKTKSSFTTNLKILEGGFETGFGAEAKAAAASVLSALGVEDATEFASNSQVFTAAASQAILEAQLAQKGPQTESDAKRIEKTTAQLGNTKEANKFILSMGLAQANKKIAQRKFYADWRKNKKTFEGAEDAWYEGEGGKSIFERPELKEYAGMSQERASDIPPPTGSVPSLSAEDADLINRNLKRGK